MRHARARLPAALVLAALASAPVALPATAGAQGLPLRGDLQADALVTGAAVSFWVGTELAKGSLAPQRCRFCGPNALDAKVREVLVVPWNDKAARVSDALAFGALPLGAAAYQLLAARGAGGSWREGGENVLYVAEAVALSASLNQVVKLAVGRERPFVHYGNYADPNRGHDPDDDLSFYSGHTTVAFSLAAAAGTIADLRGYPGAPWVWSVGMTLAATTGYARMAADKHWLTDVLVGAAAGTAIGVVVPRWLHGGQGRDDRAGGTRVTVTPLPLGVVVLF